MNAGVRARGLRLLAAGVVALSLGASPAAAGAADPYRDVSRTLAEGLLALFPTIQGYVVSASGGEAYVDAAAKDLVRPGMELQVYRPGDAMIHPVTGQVLGSYEKDLGVISVTEVRESYSRGTLDAAAAAGIVAGDRVRLSARRLRTLLHVSGAAAGIEVGLLAQALVARGEQSGRFAMIDEPGWVPSLAGLGAAWETFRADPALLRRLGELAAADLLLLARIEPGAVARIVIEVRSLRTGELLGGLNERWPAAAPAAPPAAAVPPAATAAAPPPNATVPAPPADAYVERDLAAPARSLAAGNILGEGKLEVALTDGTRLSLYRWEGAALAWRWDEDGRGRRRILSLDTTDIDGDGTSELLVTVVVHGRVTSELRRWRDGALRVAASVDGVYLRAVPRAGTALLLGQRSGIDEVLTGRVEQYRLRDGALERIEGSALPDGVGIFGLALAPSGGPVALYALDRAGYLSARTATGKVVWRSPRPYGGYPPPLSAGELFGHGVAEAQDTHETARAFQGRLLAEGVPGGVRLVVPRNFSDSPVPMASQRASGQGELAIFEGPADSPREAHRSRIFDGYVADVARSDVDGDGTAEILFVVNRSVGPLLGERGKLVAWRPGEPEPRKISP